MKKIILLLSILVSTAYVYSQKKTSGIWEGKLNTGSVSLRIVFHIENKNDSGFASTMDSPDQGVNGIPCEKTMQSGDSITILVKKGAQFSGQSEADSTINGIWKQGGMQLSLVLKKVSVVTEPKRPQTPKPPFRYNSDDVEYDNADKSIHYGATFTYPKGEGPFPTAILITGSGQQDRDETIFGHKPFAVIADYLTKRGYAVLRVDDRGMGKSTGDVANATSADFAKDVETSLAYIKNRKEVDKKRIGLIGHSEGGLIASIVASENSDIYFVIMLAGPGYDGADVLLQQNIAIMEMGGLSKQTALSYGVIYKKIEDDMLSKSDSSLYDKMLADFKRWKNSQPASILDSLHLNGSDNNDQRIASKFLSAFSSPWMKYFMQADPRPYIEKFKCKVLAIDGSKDIQVVEPDNLDAINAALKKSKSPAFETKEIPDLNHLFQHCQKCTIEEYGDLEETFAPEALEIMGDWLEKNVSKK